MSIRRNVFVSPERWVERKVRRTLCAASLLLALSGVPRAHAAELTVTTNVPGIAADGQCSLIEAIQNANADSQVRADCPAGSGSDTIHLPSNATITLTQAFALFDGLPTITSPIVIQGHGATITSSQADYFRILRVNNGDLTLNDSTISRGVLPPSASTGDASGGGILSENNSTLRISNSTIRDNSARLSGGGIFSSESTTIVDRSTIRHNLAAGGTSGGIGVEGGTLAVSNSTISGNVGDHGGGIAVGLDNTTPVTTLTVSNSTISNNSGLCVGGGAGGIFVGRGGTLTLSDSTVTGNEVTGPLNTPPRQQLRRGNFQIRGDDRLRDHPESRLRECALSRHRFSGGPLGDPRSQQYRWGQLQRDRSRRVQRQCRLHAGRH